MKQRKAISLFHLVFYFLQSNTRYFVNRLELFTCHYIYIYIYMQNSQEAQENASLLSQLKKRNLGCMLSLRIK